MSNNLNKQDLIVILRNLGTKSGSARLLSREAQEVRNKIVGILYEPEIIPYCNCPDSFIVSGNLIRPYCDKCYGFIRPEPEPPF